LNKHALVRALAIGPLVLLCAIVGSSIASTAGTSVGDKRANPDRVPRTSLGEQIGRLADEDAIRLDRAIVVFLGLG
jgi:hypothetical protein